MGARAAEGGRLKKDGRNGRESGFRLGIRLRGKMEGHLREVRLEVGRSNEDAGKVNVFLFEGARRVGRYQIRTNADGRRDVYYSDIEGKSFNGTRKVQKPAGVSSSRDSVIGAIERDLSDKGMAASAIGGLDLGF